MLEERVLAARFVGKDPFVAEGRFLCEIETTGAGSRAHTDPEQIRFRQLVFRAELPGAGHPVVVEMEAELENLDTHRSESRGELEVALRDRLVVPVAVRVAETTARIQRQIVEDLPAEIGVEPEDVVLDFGQGVNEVLVGVSGQFDGGQDGSNTKKLVGIGQLSTRLSPSGSPAPGRIGRPGRRRMGVARVVS